MHTWFYLIFTLVKPSMSISLEPLTYFQFFQGALSLGANQNASDTIG